MENFLVVVMIFCLGGILDWLNLFLALRSNMKGHGPSGFGVIAWLPYMIICLGTLHRPILIWDAKPVVLFKVLDFVAFTAFHVLCSYAIPYWHMKWLERRRRKKITPSNPTEQL